MDAAVAVIAAGTLGSALQHLGVVVAALLAAAAVLAPSTRARASAVLAALVVSPVLLASDIWSSSQVVALRDRPLVAAAGVVVGLVAIVVLATAMVRRPALLPLLAVGALPFRIPISAGGATANLLLGVYLVVGAGALAYAVTRLRAADDDAPYPPGRLEWALLGLVVLYAIQAAYSADFTKALQNVVFFYVPFALLFVLLREVRWTRRLALACVGVLVALAVVFVGVGFFEYGRKEILLNPKVVVSNQFESAFRVNSLFFDPNIYGRFLAVVMLALATLVLWARRGRDLALGGVLLALLWAGLVLTLSQSSFTALLVGLAVLAALRWDVRRTALVTVALLLVAVVLVVAAPGALRLDLGSSKSADAATSGRSDLIAGGVRLFGDRPLQGYGSGSFAREYRDHEDASGQRAVSASHTIPVTVAAEQGVGGFVVYLLLLATAFGRLARGARRSPERAFLAAAFAALVAHTLLYASFLEDPLAWVLLAVGTAFAAAEP